MVRPISNTMLYIPFLILLLFCLTGCTPVLTLSGEDAIIAVGEEIKTTITLQGSENAEIAIEANGMSLVSDDNSIYAPVTNVTVREGNTELTWVAVSPGTSVIKTVSAKHKNKDIVFNGYVTVEVLSSPLIFLKDELCLPSGYSIAYEIEACSEVGDVSLTVTESDGKPYPVGLEFDPETHLLLWSDPIVGEYFIDIKADDGRTPPTNQTLKLVILDGGFS